MQLYWQLHPGVGPHLLLLHGFLSSSAQWQPNLAALSAVCQPVTVELWGHHRSPTPDDPAQYEPDNYIDQFEAIREQIGCQQWLLCGYSLGAGLVLAYGQRHPQRVLAQAFTNSSSAFADADQQRIWAEQAPVTAEKLLSGGTKALSKIPVHPCHAMRLPTPIKQALVADAQKHSVRGIANTLLYTNPKVSMRDRIHANERPTLLLWGNRERRFVAHKNFAEQHMPHLQIAELDAGHGVNMEAHTDFNRTLCQFISLNS